MTRRLPHPPFAYVCPRCKALLNEDLSCPNGHGPFRTEAGIGRFLLPERAAHLARFMAEYETVRRAEGRGADEAAYYRSLPFQDTTGTHAAAWKIRAAGFRAFLNHVVKPQARCKGTPLDVLDLGAGNGWLAYRLAKQGHRVAAVDLQTNAFDGLGAHVHYDAPFPCIQAEFEHLPFSDAQFDVIVFNASVHYATAYESALQEALRVLRPIGRLVLLDSPVYEDETSGKQMVAEREAHFLKTYGFASDALPAEQYLTRDRLAALAERLGLTWRYILPRHGLKWRLRPALARVLRRREPAQFYVIEGRRRPDWPPALLATLAPPGPRWLVRGVDLAYRLRYHLIQKRQLDRPARERIGDLTLTIPPGVFNPVPFRTAQLMVEAVNRHARPGQRVLDVGTGSGLGALLAAHQGGTVDAVDLNPEAVLAARHNAWYNKLAETVQVHQGDLYAPVEGRRYDLILFNPPFFAGPPEDLADAALRSVDVIVRFADGLPRHLRAGGKALVLYSTRGCMARFLDTFLSRKFYIQIVAQERRTNEILYAFLIEPAP